MPVITIKHIYFVFALLLFLCACGKTTLQRLGTSTIASNPKRIRLIVTNYCPPQGWVHQDLFVKNFSYVPTALGADIDTHRFGIPDSQGGGADLIVKDGHYSPLVLKYLGISADKIPTLPKCLSDVDSDQDGLTDCEEKLLGSNPTSFDTDGNGIPDLLSLYSGLGLNSGSSPGADSDGDGVSDYEEIRMGTPVHEKNTADIQNYAVEYSIVSHTNENSICYDIATKIPIVDVSNDNLVRFLINQRNNDGTSRMLNVSLTIPFDAESEITRTFGELFPNE